MSQRELFFEDGKDRRSFWFLGKEHERMVLGQKHWFGQLTLNFPLTSENFADNYNPTLLTDRGSGGQLTTSTSTSLSNQQKYKHKIANLRRCMSRVSFGSKKFGPSKLLPRPNLYFDLKCFQLFTEARLKHTIQHLLK